MTGTAIIGDLAPQRRHTLYFLRATKDFAPVFLDTEIDVSAVRRHRDGQSWRVSTVTYILQVAAQVIAAHPAANAAILDGVLPKIAHYESVSGKLTLDKTIDGHRVVLAAVIDDLDRLPLREIQTRIEYFRDGDPATLPEFEGVRKLHGISSWRAAAEAFADVVRPLTSRQKVWGSFAVTSLGHRPVDSFHSVGGTTITLGVGQIADRPVVRDNAVAIAPILRLSLAFDHRVIDGAEAADILAEIKQGLENFREDTR